MEAALISVFATGFLAMAGVTWRLGTIIGSFKAELVQLHANDATTTAAHGRIYDRLDTHGNRITALETWRSGLRT